ncbi:MAG: hypothetical protein JWO57_1425 [Pseudonocardiales bacterium]|nr:hypothetical protein [Pseudonocardiales bacterium]
MSEKREAIQAIYRQVNAPEWAAPNLDGLADVLRDLSWLPEGRVRVAVPDLSALTEDERRALLDVLRRAVEESAESARPVLVEL